MGLAKYQCKQCQFKITMDVPVSLVTGLDKVRCNSCGQIGSWKDST